MCSLLTYSGITTKIKAMGGKLITQEEFDDMAQLEQVSEAVDFLKRKSPYINIFCNMEENDLHRGKIEELLTLSLYQDFAKIYRFSDLKQRHFLDLYFLHFEIIILKKCLRNIISDQPFEMDLSIFQDFFDHHSTIDLKKITSSASIEEFYLNLEGSKYFPLLKQIQNKENLTFFDYEMQFDIYYFHSIWKIKKKNLSNRERAILLECNGTKLDLLNIQWIYRSKKYYKLSNAQIYALIIPLPYRLTKQELIDLVESTSNEDFYHKLQTTYYSKILCNDFSQSPDLEKLYEKALFRVYKQTSKRVPYSIASLNSYLYFKEIEIRKIITIIEGIRYGLKPDVINSYVIKIT